MPTAAIIGASRGIGLGLVEQLRKRRVAGARDDPQPRNAPGRSGRSRVTCTSMVSR